MPVKKGRLRPQDEFCIRKNYSYLLTNLDPDEFTDHLISAMVLTTDDVDNIKNVQPTTRQGRAERFLTIFERAGEEAYDTFLEALNNSGNEHIAQQLQGTDISDVQSGGAFSWIDELPDETKNRRMTDQHASRLSAAFGNNWQAVFIELKISQPKIQQTELTYKHIPTAITNLIIGWKQREAGKATFKAFLAALQKVDDHCTIDWDVVHKVVEENS